MMYRVCRAFLVVWISVAGLAAAQDAPPEAPDDEAAIRSAIESYVAAFNARDVEKLVKQWSPEGVYTIRTSGERAAGREALAEQFAAVFAEEIVPRLAVVTDSIEFISPNVALERGVATVTRAEDDVAESKYSVVYVKKDGAWLIDRVTEDEVVAQPSNYEHLQDLEWLIGEWTDDSEEVAVELSCRWTRNQNYIARTYAVTRGDDVESSGLQIIGWDARTKQIRSWLFDSDGGFVAGVWSKRDDQWVVQSVATLADGGSGSFTSVHRPLDEDSFAWKKINQVVDGELLPNIDEIIIRRKAGEATE